MDRDILESITAQGWIAWINLPMLQYAPIHRQNQLSYLFHLVARQGSLLLTLFRWSASSHHGMLSSPITIHFKLCVFMLCSLQLQMNILGSSSVWQKKCCRWFSLRSLIRTSGTPYSLGLGCTMQVWMKEIDLWLRNFLQITRSRFLSPEWSIFFSIPSKHILQTENETINSQVLVCTSTLAWGVNLPAHLVIIKVRHKYAYILLCYIITDFIGTSPLVCEDFFTIFVLCTITVLGLLMLAQM